MNQYLDVVIKNVTLENSSVKIFELSSVTESKLPVFSAGSHIDIHISDGVIRQYSIINEPETNVDKYLIAVKREKKSRGGSEFIFNNFKVGNIIKISTPRNNFPLNLSRMSYILIAGGIGITPIYSMACKLMKEHKKFKLFYTVRNEKNAILVEKMKHNFHERFFLHISEYERINFDDIFSGERKDLSVYVCGPRELVDNAKKKANEQEIYDINFELFSVENSASEKSSSFEVIIKSTGEKILVPANKSILDILEENNIKVDSSCKEGLCSSCEVGLLDGKADHKDYVLTEVERETNSRILTCCSRSITPSLTLDL